MIDQSYTPMAQLLTRIFMYPEMSLGSIGPMVSESPFSIHFLDTDEKSTRLEGTGHFAPSIETSIKSAASTAEAS